MFLLFDLFHVNLCVYQMIDMGAVMKTIVIWIILVQNMWIINVDTVMHSRSLLKSNLQMTGDITFVVYMCLIYI